MTTQIANTECTNGQGDIVIIDDCVADVQSNEHLYPYHSSISQAIAEFHNPHIAQRVLAEAAVNYEHNKSAPWWIKVPDEVPQELLYALNESNAPHFEYVPDFAYLAYKMDELNTQSVENNCVNPSKIAHILTLIATFINATAYGITKESAFFRCVPKAASTIDSLHRVSVIAHNYGYYDDIPEEVRAYSVLCSNNKMYNLTLISVLNSASPDKYYPTLSISGDKLLRGSASASKRLRKYLQKYHDKLDWYLHDVLVYPTHGQVICYKSYDDVIKGKVSVERVGSFLRRVLPDSVPDHEINDMVNSLKTGVVKFLTDEDGIREAYLHPSCSTSCMCCEFEKYQHHPSAVYAELPNVAVAVLYFEDGEQAARAVVNTETKKFCYVYGDYTLRAKLYDLGYTHDYSYLDGVKVRKLYTDETESRYIMPYIDGDANMFTALEDEPYHELSTCGDYTADVVASSYPINPNYMSCDNCGHTFEEDDLVGVYDNEFVCEYCQEHSYVHACIDEDEFAYVHHNDVVECIHSGETIHDGVAAIASDGEYVAQWYVEAYEEWLEEQEEDDY